MLISPDMALQGELEILVSIFFMLLGGTLGLPFPEDALIVLGGILAAAGKVHILNLLIVCTTAVTIGDIAMYLLGRFFGASLLEYRFFKKRLSEARIAEVRKFLERRRFVTILIARHLFYLRGVTFFTCGCVGMKFSHFLLADFLAALVSVPIVMSLGYFGANTLEASLGLADNFKFLSLILGFILIAAALAYLWIRRKRRAVFKKNLAA